MAKFKISDLRNKHFLSLAGNGVIAVLGFVLIALVARTLSKTDAGTWFFFLMICALGDAVRNGFLGTATIKFYAGAEPVRAQEVLGSVWYVALVTTAILVLLNIAFIPFLPSIKNDALVISVRWFGATFISSLPFNLMFWILVAEEKYGKILWLRLINSGSMILYIIVLLLLHKMTLEALLWCNFLTNCLASVVGLLWGLGRVRTFFRRSRQCTMELVNFGKYSLGSTLASRLLGSTDTFFITFMLDTAALAEYTLPVRLMELVEFILRSFVSTGMSGMAIAYNNKNEHQTKYIFKKYTGMLTIAFVPLTIFVLIFSGLIMHILGGYKYVGSESANIFRILMVLALFYPLDRFIGVTLDIIHKPKLNLYKVFIMLAFAIAGDYLGLIIFKNIYGIAFASFFTLFSGVVFGYINLNKYLKVPLYDVLGLGYSEMKGFLQRLLFKMR